MWICISNFNSQGKMTKRQVLKIRFYNSKQRKELPMTKEAKIRITIEIGNSQKISAEFVIQSGFFWATSVGKSVAIRMKIWGWRLRSLVDTILSYITELADHTFRHKEIKAKNQVKSRASKRKKSKVAESCGQQASFLILNAGKASVPYFDLYRNIIHSETIS